VSRCGLHFGKGPSPSPRVANERVASMVNRQSAQTIPAQNTAGRVKAAPQDVAVEGIAIRRSHSFASFNAQLKAPARRGLPRLRPRSHITTPASPRP
jgi:hypothetical protein